MGKIDGWYNHSQRIRVWDRVKNEGSTRKATASMIGGYWMRWMVGTITAREYLCGIGLRMKGVEPLWLEAILGEMDGWYNHSRRIPVWDRVKNEGSRATMTGGYIG